jgi:hypothetical protein
MKLAEDGWPEEISMTRLAWSSVNPPYQQPGGRYWPAGDNTIEYAFHREADELNGGKKWDDQIIIFRQAN